MLTLPAYTHALGEDWGNADLVLTWVIFLSIFARLGFGEALLRHWYTARPEQRPRLQRTIQWSVAAVSAVLGGILVLIAPWFADSVLSGVDPASCASRVRSLIYCNLDLAQALLRARDDRRTYLLTSVTNVLLTVTLTVLLVVVFDRVGARLPRGQLRRLNGRAPLPVGAGAAGVAGSTGRAARLRAARCRGGRPDGDRRGA